MSQESLRALAECVKNATELLDKQTCQKLYMKTIFELEKLPNSVLSNLLQFLRGQSLSNLLR